MPFRWRPDADFVPGVPLIRRIMPFLMRTRTESAVYFEQKIDVANTDAFLAAFRERTGLRATYLHLMVWALARTLAERPRLNRFTAGGRIWQRRGIWITFSGKKAKTDDHPLVTVKLLVEPEWTLSEVVERVERRIGDARSDKASTTDKELGILFRLPTWLLSLLTRLVFRLDAWGLLPRFFVDNDPLFTSVFLANLGSINMHAAYHHLYEYGNCPIFVVAGKVQEDTVIAADGPAVRRLMTLKYSLDERIEDGLYCARALELFRTRLEDPDGA